MTLRDQFRELLTLPVAMGSTAAALVAGSLGYLDGIIALVSETAGSWYPMVALFSSQIAPKLPSIPTALVRDALLVASFIYLAILGDRFIRKARQ
jgi:hypothetical protein